MSALTDSMDELRKNDRQWEAFLEPENCVVLAPPGSGKTKLLTTRVAYDLLNRIPEPHGAACITLTNAAANEIRRRLSRLVGRDRSTLFVGTVHSFALRHVVIPFAGMVGRDDLIEASIASEEAINKAFNAAIRKVYGYEADTYAVRSTVEILRRQLATDAQWARSGARPLAVAQQYENLLSESGLQDFEHVIAGAVELVEDHSLIRKALNARFPRIYVDEYQDLAPGLDRLVSALCFDNSERSVLFAVGDPDQAVFGWTGTKPELLTDLAENEAVHPVRLQRNYRSRQEILNAANRMRTGQLPMIGDRAGGTAEAIRCKGGFPDQCEHAVQTIKEFYEGGTPLHEIVAICHNRECCQAIADALRDAGIPAFYRGSEYRLTESTALIEGCGAWVMHGRESSGYRLSELIRQWRSILGRRYNRSRAVELVDTLLRHEGRQEGVALNLVDELIELGLISALEMNGRSDDAKEVENLRKSLDEGALHGLTLATFADRALRSNRVEVTTMVSSKGLEFDVVVLLGADKKWMPDFRSIGEKMKEAEDRRKFYVSITRARDHLCIFYSGFVTWRSGRTDPAGPSPYLREIGLI